MNIPPNPENTPRRSKPLTHKGTIPSEVLDAAQLLAPTKPTTHLAYSDGRVNQTTVVNHLADIIGSGEIPKPVQEHPKPVEDPKTHKSAQISKTNPLHRLPKIDLELDKTFLGLPIVEVRLLLTKALRENHAPQILYKFLALCFGVPNGFSKEEYTAIALTQLALLYENKDDIIAKCRDPEFSQNEVADFISRKTGLLLDVHSDPNETIRLIENGLNAASALLNKIPKDSNLNQDEQNIKDAFANTFPYQNIKFYDHFQQIRKIAFDDYEQKHPVEPAHPQGEQRVVTVYKPKSELHLDIKENLARQLVAYLKNAPQPTPENYMSANQFRSYLIAEGYIVSNAVRDENSDPFIQDAIDEGLLDRWVPNCDDTRDNTEKILDEEVKAYYFNVLRIKTPETNGTKAFRAYVLKEHPNFASAETDKVFQEKIQGRIIPPYEPQYTEKTSIKKILEDEALAYKLNLSKNRDPQAERDALEKHLKEQRNILAIKGTKFPSTVPEAISEADLTAFLDRHFANIL